MGNLCCPVNPFSYEAVIFRLGRCNLELRQPFAAHEIPILFKKPYLIKIKLEKVIQETKDYSKTKL